MLVGAVGSSEAEIGGEVVVTPRGKYRANALGTVCLSIKNARRGSLREYIGGFEYVCSGGGRPGC